MDDLALMFYNARWYDPTVAHFVQAVAWCRTRYRATTVMLLPSILDASLKVRYIDKQF